MTNESIATLPSAPDLPAGQVYFMATLCLAAGLAAGYLLHSSPAPRGAPHAAITANATPAGHHPGLKEMREMADKQAAPLIEKLKSNPNDTSLLVQVAAMYHTTHRFKEAAGYYSRAVDSDPKSVAIRTKLASSLYRSGDIDGAITQLNRALNDQPTDANALFDLGMIKLQGNGDARGALATWQRLLKTNPSLSPERKATVLKMMADAMTMAGDQHGIEKARSNGHE
jgi:cytochrome c-type biogenesis protein CcmH/NrfG